MFARPESARADSGLALSAGRGSRTHTPREGTPALKAPPRHVAPCRPMPRFGFPSGPSGHEIRRPYRVWVGTSGSRATPSDHVRWSRCGSTLRQPHVKTPSRAPREYVSRASANPKRGELTRLVVPQEIAEQDVPPGRQLQGQPPRDPARDLRGPVQATRLDRLASLDLGTVMMTVAPEND